MKTARAFAPAVSDQLETRCVPSTFGTTAFHHDPGTFSQNGLPSLIATPNGILALGAVPTSTAVHHDPGTFSQNGFPSLRTTPFGILAVGAATPTTTHATTTPVKPAATFTTVHHDPGTFSNGFPSLRTTPFGTFAVGRFMMYYNRFR